MVGLEGYVKLLRDEGHTEKTFTVDAAAMRNVSKKAAKFIFHQMQSKVTS